MTEECIIIAVLERWRGAKDTSPAGMGTHLPRTEWCHAHSITLSVGQREGDGKDRQTKHGKVWGHAPGQHLMAWHGCVCQHPRAGKPLAPFSPSCQAQGELGTAPHPICICIPAWGSTLRWGWCGGLAQLQQQGSTGTPCLGCRSPSFTFCDPLDTEEGERGAHWPVRSTPGWLQAGFSAGAGATDLEQARRCAGVPWAAVLPGGSCVSTGGCCRNCLGCRGLERVRVLADDFRVLQIKLQPSPPLPRYASSLCPGFSGTPVLLLGYPGGL